MENFGILIKITYLVSHKTSLIPWFWKTSLTPLRCVLFSVSKLSNSSIWLLKKININSHGQITNIAYMDIENMTKMS